MISQRMRPNAATLVFTSYLFAAGTICAAAEKTITDASGRSIKLSDTSRILSIGGDITEILYALKADGKIIAVDLTSLFPAEALQQKPDVGYLRALSAEGVLSTNPTLIIAAKDAGPPPVVAVLKASAIPYLEVPDDQTPEGVAAKSSAKPTPSRCAWRSCRRSAVAATSRSASLRRRTTWTR